MLLLSFLADARAQMEVCAGSLPLAEWDDAMDQVDDALVALDGARSDGILDDLVHELRCLDVPAPPAQVGRMARQISLVAFFAQDPDELSYWGLLARETAGGAPWPEDVPVPARFLELVAALPEPELRVLDEQGLVVPKGGGALLDGRILRETGATVGAQHLLQIADKKGVVTFTGWQTGPAFPEDWLGDPVELDVPRWYVEPPAPPSFEVVPAPAPDPVAPAPAPVAAAPDPVAAAPDPVPVGSTEPTLTFDGDGSAPGCPWTGVPSDIDPGGKVMSIAGVGYPVKTDDEQYAFRKLLRTCGEFRAARRFAKWRDARGEPFAGAGRWKESMVDALLTPEPKRKKKPKPAP